VHLGKTTPGDFANDLRRRPRIRSYLADLSSFAARAICAISPRAEYNKESRKAGEVKFSISCLPAFLIHLLLTHCQTFEAKPLAGAQG
jgi:hypothetical protein